MDGKDNILISISEVNVAFLQSSVMSQLYCFRSIWKFWQNSLVLEVGGKDCIPFCYLMLLFIEQV